MTDADLLQRLHAVHDGMSNNSAYPNPPVDMAGFKTAIDAYTATVSAALDGGKAAIVERDKCRADVIIMLRLLGHYVEAACKNDTPTFVSSGFVAASTARTPPQPVSQSAIAAVDQGNTGQLVVTIRARHQTRSMAILAERWMGRPHGRIRLSLQGGLWKITKGAFVCIIQVLQPIW